jgi:tRNA(Ile)-lysidine synthase TilS/MesJ
MPLEKKTDYAAWEKEQAATLTSLRGKNVCLLFSGGKDSSLSLHFLLAASEDFEFKMQVYAITFPKHRYGPSEVDRIDAFWKERGLAIQWYETGTSDDSLETADNPCIVCIQTRKRLLYEAIGSKCADLNSLVLVTGYALWDLVSYSLEYLMGGIYTHPDEEEMQRSQERFMETGQRFYPILKTERGYSIYRPILQYNTQDVVRIIQEASIPILSAPCHYARFRPKRILESYYKSMRLRFDYDSVVDFAKECLGLPSTSEYYSRSKEYFLKQKLY